MLPRLSSAFAETNTVSRIVFGYRDKSSNSKEMSFFGPNGVQNKLNPKRDATRPVYLFAKFCVSDPKSDAAGENKRTTAAAA